MFSCFQLIDIQFLHGYYEPTLLIVYEPVRTFPGRIAVRTDTCTMVAISLNIQQRVHPIIWTVAALPFDCTQVLAIKKPIGLSFLRTNGIFFSLILWPNNLQVDAWLCRTMH